MTCQLVALCIDANDPLPLARFWAGVLGWKMAVEADDDVVLLPSDDTGFQLRFVQTEQQKTGKNARHFDLTSTSLADQQHTVARARALGARHIDIGQGPDASHVVLADPEGNEFCVIEPGNQFLADCGFIGAVACDGSQQAGYFWSEALGWPLVWDQDQETAIRSPHGGPKITWGGEEPTPTAGRNRFHFDLAPTAPSDQQSEIERLLRLGASLMDDGPVPDGRVRMVDPDGQEFRVLTAR